MNFNQMPTVLHAGFILTNSNPNFIRDGYVVLKDDRILKVGKWADFRFESVGTCEMIELPDSVVMPGFVQPHIHLVQTLFRGFADDLYLMDWLKTRIFPFENLHN